MGIILEVSKSHGEVFMHKEFQYLTQKVRCHTTVSESCFYARLAPTILKFSQFIFHFSPSFISPALLRMKYL